MTWLSDLIHSEMRRLRPNYSPTHFARETLLNSAQADIDSIELVDVASVLFAILDAEDSGALTRFELGRSFGAWCDFVAAAVPLSNQIGFFSSGTSGARKLCFHRYESLQAELDELLEALPVLASATQIVLAVPSHHIYGFLFGALLPLRLGLAAQKLNIANAATLRAHAGRGSSICIASPKLIEELIADGKAFKHATMVLSAGSALSEPCFSALKALQVSLVVDLYGSSETAGLGYRTSAGPFQARKLPVEYFKTAPDQLQWRSDHEFCVGPRLDRQVQVAGVNVSFERIEQLMRSFPGVISAQAWLNGKGAGARIAATIRSEASLHLPDLRDFLRGQLSAAELPAQIDLIS